MVRQDPSIHERIAVIVGDRNNREIYRLTGVHHETVRRILNGQAPSTEFLRALCRATNVNAHWLLMGTGPMMETDTLADALRQAGPSDLLMALAESVARFGERMRLIESGVHVLEDRSTHGGAENGHSDRPAQNGWGEDPVLVLQQHSN